MSEGSKVKFDLTSPTGKKTTCLVFWVSPTAFNKVWDTTCLSNCTSPAGKVCEQRQHGSRFIWALCDPAILHADFAEFGEIPLESCMFV